MADPTNDRLSIAAVRPWVELLVIVGAAAFAAASIMVTTTELRAQFRTVSATVDQLARVYAEHDDEIGILEHGSVRTETRLKGAESRLDRITDFIVAQFDWNPERK